jgi:hypothetical protein
MGLKKSGAEWGEGQWASFFCLENKYWRIMGLDTGYNATGFDWGRMPVFGRSKWIRKSVHFKPRCEFPEAQMQWLKGTVNPDSDKRGLIVLTHHGCYSAFSDWYQIPAKQLTGGIHRPGACRSSVAMLPTSNARGWPGTIAVTTMAKRLTSVSTATRIYL